MYQCPNCGGELVFDPSSQQVSCKSCSGKFNPNEVLKDQDSETDEYLDVTIYKCPQCGGEITTTDNTVADFCSFCGAATILSGRLDKTKRPNYIIPFKKTKEDCKNAYTKFTSKAIFTPSEYKDAKYIDSFRGIYMPYWSYNVTQRGPARVKGEKSYRRGDYIYTDHYDIYGDENSYYNGLSFDASSSFNDNISEKIAPFDAKDLVKFTPSYLLGFYADTADVPADVYSDSAADFAAEESLKFIKKQNEVRKYEVKTTAEKAKSALNTKVEGAQPTMFPVWFMSYRKNNRVSYATVNGQTGKVCADMPVSLIKYLIGSLLLAIPLFLLMNSFLVLLPKTILTIVMISALITIIMYNYELAQIIAKDKGEGDLGFLYMLQKNKKNSNANNSNVNVANASKKDEKPKKKKKENNFLILIGVVAIVFFVLFFGYGIVSVLIDFFGDATYSILFFILAFIGIIVHVNSTKKLKEIAIKASIPGSIFSCLSLVIGFVICAVNPASDLYYYGAVIVSLFSMFFTLMSMIKYYNILASRKLPQFDLYEGGDDRA